MDEALLERFWAKVERTEGCWNWTACRVRGYGIFWAGGERGKVKAHRLSYELAKGDIPIGTEIDHLCRNPACVNPAHLEAVTHRENMRRSPKYLYGRNHRDKTHCHKGHPFDEENTYYAKRGRECRACRAAANRRWAKRQSG